MAVLKIKILFLFLLSRNWETPVQCQTPEEYDYYTEETTEAGPPIPVDNLTHVRTKNLSGNVKLTTLQVLTTNTPLDISDTTEYDDEEEGMFDKTADKNKQDEAQTIPEDQQKVISLSKSTKAPTDGMEPFVLMDVFNSTSGEEPISVRPLNSEPIRDSTQRFGGNSGEIDKFKDEGKIETTEGDKENSFDALGLITEAATNPGGEDIEDVASFINLDEEFLNTLSDKGQDLESVSEPMEDISSFLDSYSAVTKLAVEEDQSDLAAGYATPNTTSDSTDQSMLPLEVEEGRNRHTSTLLLGPSVTPVKNFEEETTTNTWEDKIAQSIFAKNEDKMKMSSTINFESEKESTKSNEHEDKVLTLEDISTSTTNSVVQFEQEEESRTVDKNEENLFNAAVTIKNTELNLESEEDDSVILDEKVTHRKTETSEDMTTTISISDDLFTTSVNSEDTTSAAIELEEESSKSITLEDKEISTTTSTERSTVDLQLEEQNRRNDENEELVNGSVGLEEKVTHRKPETSEDMTTIISTTNSIDVENTRDLFTTSVTSENLPNTTSAPIELQESNKNITLISQTTRSPVDFELEEQNSRNDENKELVDSSIAVEEKVTERNYEQLEDATTTNSVDVENVGDLFTSSISSGDKIILEDIPTSTANSALNFELEEEGRIIAAENHLVDKNVDLEEKFILEEISITTSATSSELEEQNRRNDQNEELVDSLEEKVTERNFQKLEDDTTTNSIDAENVGNLFISSISSEDKIIFEEIPITTSTANSVLNFELEKQGSIIGTGNHLVGKNVDLEEKFILEEISTTTSATSSKLEEQNRRNDEIEELVGSLEEKVTERNFKKLEDDTTTNSIDAENIGDLFTSSISSEDKLILEDIPTTTSTANSLINFELEEEEEGMSGIENEDYLVDKNVDLDEKFILEEISTTSSELEEQNTGSDEDEEQLANNSVSLEDMTTTISSTNFIDEENRTDLLITSIIPDNNVILEESSTTNSAVNFELEEENITSDENHEGKVMLEDISTTYSAVNFETEEESRRGNENEEHLVEDMPVTVLIANSLVDFGPIEENTVGERNEEKVTNSKSKLDPKKESTVGENEDLPTLEDKIIFKDISRSNSALNLETGEASRRGNENGEQLADNGVNLEEKVTQRNFEKFEDMSVTISNTSSITEFDPKEQNRVGDENEDLPTLEDKVIFEDISRTNSAVNLETQEASRRGNKNGERLADDGVNLEEKFEDMSVTISSANSMVDFEPTEENTVGNGNEENLLNTDVTFGPVEDNLQEKVTQQNFEKLEDNSVTISTTDSMTEFDSKEDITTTTSTRIALEEEGSDKKEEQLVNNGFDLEDKVTQRNFEKSEDMSAVVSTTDDLLYTDYWPATTSPILEDKVVLEDISTTISATNSVINFELEEESRRGGQKEDNTTESTNFIDGTSENRIVLDDISTTTATIILAGNVESEESNENGEDSINTGTVLEEISTITSATNFDLEEESRRGDKNEAQLVNSRVTLEENITQSNSEELETTVSSTADFQLKEDEYLVNNNPISGDKVEESVSLEGEEHLVNNSILTTSSSVGVNSEEESISATSTVPSEQLLGTTVTLADNITFEPNEESSTSGLTPAEEKENNEDISFNDKEEIDINNLTRKEESTRVPKLLTYDLKEEDITVTTGKYLHEDDFQQDFLNVVNTGLTDFFKSFIESTEQTKQTISNEINDETTSPATTQIKQSEDKLDHNSIMFHPKLTSDEQIKVTTSTSFLEEGAEPQLQANLNGESTQFSIKIIQNVTSFFVPSDAFVTLGAPNIINITWRSECAGLNNSLVLNLGNSVQLSVVKGTEMHIHKAELISDDRLISFDDGTSVYFSNVDLLKADKRFLTAGAPKETLVAEITGACLGIAVITALLIYFVVKKFKAKTRNFKPNSTEA